MSTPLSRCNRAHSARPFVGLGYRPAATSATSRTVTSAPNVVAVAAISRPMNPAADQHEPPPGRQRPLKPLRRRRRCAGSARGRAAVPAPAVSAGCRRWRTVLRRRELVSDPSSSTVRVAGSTRVTSVPVTISTSLSASHASGSSCSDSKVSVPGQEFLRQRRPLVRALRLIADQDDASVEPSSA